MTFAEKCRQEYPELINTELGYPKNVCPHELGYEIRKCGLCNTSCCECWNREIPEEKPNPWGSKQHQLQQLSKSLWNKYVSFQEAGFDKAQAFDLTKLEYEAMLDKKI